MKLKQKAMADIAKCDGNDCELSEACYRYLAKSDDRYQSYIMPIKRGLGCTYFWSIIDEPDD